MARRLKPRTSPRRRTLFLLPLASVALYWAVCSPGRPDGDASTPRNRPLHHRPPPLSSNPIKAHLDSFVRTSRRDGSDKHTSASAVASRPISHNEKIHYWRYDEVGPSIVEGRTLQLPSVPAEHRLPVTPNVTAFFSEPSNIYPAREYLFDYNPSIVRLPPNQRHTDDYPNAVYLASFRVSNQNYCFHPEDRKRMVGNIPGSSRSGHEIPLLPPKAKDLLGLALLSADLEVVADGVLDLPHAPGFAGAQDFRLFVLPHGKDPSESRQLYITSNDVISPLWIVAPGLAVQKPLNQVYGTLKAWTRSFLSCASCGKKRGMCGKNMNYFSSEQGSHHVIDHLEQSQQALVEIWPSPPHLVRPVNLSIPCRRGLEPEQVSVGPAIPNVASPATNHNDIVVPPPQPSFATIEGVLFPDMVETERTLLTRGRGSACCLALSRPTADDPDRVLWMGMEHSKTPSQGRQRRRLPDNVQPNHYFSRLYAFEMTPPHALVARSGYFCLGFPDEEEGDDASNNLVHVTSWRKLALGNATFQCPRIHFVSGMTMDATDPSLVIVAYGVNDCLSRLVRVRLEELERILFGPLQ